MKSVLGLSVVLVAAVVIVGSCKKDDATVYGAPEEFAVKIDTVRLEKNVARTDTLRARLWGRIGNTTCYQLSRYQTVSRDSFQATIKVFGLHTPSSSCRSAIVELRASIYRIHPIYPGKFVLFIQQPDGRTIKDSTNVL